jgi:AcrR family transcriptional regulator
MECFSRAGYNATGVAEICALADVSKGAFYHHFPTKQSVFQALLEEWLITIDAMLSTSRQSTTAVPEALRKMSELMTLIFTQAGGRLPMFLEFWTQASHDPIIWQEVIQPYQRYATYFSTMIQEGISEGSLRPVDADISARMIVAIALGLLLQGLLDPTGADWGQVTKTSIQYLLDGLAIY